MLSLEIIELLNFLDFRVADIKATHKLDFLNEIECPQHVSRIITARNGSIRENRETSKTVVAQPKLLSCSPGWRFISPTLAFHGSAHERKALSEFEKEVNFPEKRKKQKSKSLKENQNAITLD